MPEVPAWLLGAWEVDAAALPPERRAKLVGGRLDVRADAFELYDFPETIFDRRWPLEACVVSAHVVELRADTGFEDVSLEAAPRAGGLTMTVGGVDVMGWKVEHVPMRRVDL